MSSRDASTDKLTIRPEHTHPGGVLLCDDEYPQKLGFHGAEPTLQRSGAIQAKLAANATLADTVALVNELRDALVEKGLIKGS